jgi:hypothetical protein
VINLDMTPRRRCVAFTPTPVTCAAGTTPPGTDRSRVNALVVPMTSAPSVATSARSGSNNCRPSSLGDGSNIIAAPNSPDSAS